MTASISAPKTSRKRGGAAVDSATNVTLGYYHAER